MDVRHFDILGHEIMDINPHLYINFSVEDYANYSNYTGLWIKRSNLEIGLKTLAIVPIIVLGLLGNSAIIIVVLRVKSMRTSTNLFILNMAIADLMTILFCSWTIIIFDSYQNFILGKTHCRLHGFLQVSFLLSSVFSLVVISGDRLLGIVFPFSRRLTRGQAIVILAVIWVVAIVCGSPLAIWRYLQTRKWRDYEEIWCLENKNILKYYWIIILTLLVYVPLIAMTVAYCVIIIQLDKYERQLFQREQNPHKMNYRKNVIKVLFIYLLNFIICWVLFQVVVLYRYFILPHVEISNWFRHVFFAAHVLAYAQSSINPVLYGVYNERFRSAFRSTCRCLFKNNRVKPIQIECIQLQDGQLPNIPHLESDSDHQNSIDGVSSCTEEAELKALKVETEIFTPSTSSASALSVYDMREI